IEGHGIAVRQQDLGCRVVDVPEAARRQSARTREMQRRGAVTRIECSERLKKATAVPLDGSDERDGLECRAVERGAEALEAVKGSRHLQVARGCRGIPQRGAASRLIPALVACPDQQ